MEKEAAILTALPTWLNKRTIGIAVVCAGGVALLLYPASMITLGLGTVLGYKGKDWLREYFHK